MAVTLTSIVTLVRYLLGDTSKSMIPGDTTTYDNSAVFTLSESNATEVTAVLVNDSESGVSYSYDVDTQAVTVTSSLDVGDTVEIQFSYYSDYSNSEIQDYINAAIIHLSVNNFYDFTISNNMIFPDPTPQEQRLIAMVASLLIQPDNRSYRLPDLSITTPKDLPVHDKIRKTIMIMKSNSHGTFNIL